jgi:hypothetical protein
MIVLHRYLPVKMSDSGKNMQDALKNVRPVTNADMKSGRSEAVRRIPGPCCKCPAYPGLAASQWFGGEAISFRCVSGCLSYSALHVRLQK